MKIVSSWALIFPVHFVCRIFIIYQSICNKVLGIKGSLWAQMTKVFSVYIDILCSRTICENLCVLTDFLPTPCASNNHSCFQAQHLEPHLVSLLKSKLASLYANKDWPCTEQHWKCLQLAFLGGREGVDMLLFLALVYISQMSTLC